MNRTPHGSQRSRPPAAGAGPNGRNPSPWADVRLWAGMALAFGLALVADLAWGTALPGLAPPAAEVGAAAVLGSAASLLAALHPRLPAWIARGGRTVPVPWVVMAAVLAPPRLGTGFWRFVWTLALLLWVWWVVERIARALAPGASGNARGRRPVAGAHGGDGRTVGDALLWPLCSLGLWVALCDLALATPAPGWDATRLLGAAPVAVAGLLLASWWARGECMRRARAEGAVISTAFASLWWWAAVPAVAACLLLAMLWPHYPAPLQGGGLQRLVLAAVSRLGKAPAQAGQGRGGTAAVVLLVLSAAVALVLAWPGRRLVRRVVRRIAGQADAGDDELEQAVTWGARLLGWWWALLALLGLRRPRRRPVRHGSWRPLAPPGPPPRRAAAPAPSPTWDRGPRGQVRAAYGQFLQGAAGEGLRRGAAHTPRGFMRWVVPRAAPVRFPLESLTATYEEARFSRHEVGEQAAAQAGVDARAALYALHMAARRRSASPAPDRRAWTPPRGVSRRRSVD